MGRHSEYTIKRGEDICEKIATSTLSLKSICKAEGMPDVITVLRWLKTFEEFRISYTRAKEEQADMLAEEILDIADDGSNDFMTITKGDQMYEMENKEWTSRSKLRVEARKWLASKLKAKKYGDKLEHSGSVEVKQITGIEVK